MSRENAISLDSVSKSFGQIRCLRQISMRVCSGEIIAIVGSNGCGKTTLLDIMSGLTSADEGRVRIRGCRANRRPPAWFAGHGVLRTFQSPRAFEQMLVESCLALACEVPHPSGIVSSILRTKSYRQRKMNAKARVEQLTMRLGWENMLTKRAEELSYGQRKLLAVAQLHLADGLLGICDEPTAGLDVRKADLALSLLRDWHRDRGDRAMVIATHDLERVEGFAHRTYRISSGRIEETNCAS